MLPTTGLSPGVTVQCARCGKQFTLGTEPVLESRTSGKAVTSLVLGLLPVPVLTGIPAIILGIWALIDIRRQAGLLKGSGLAVCGIIFGSLCSVVCGPIVGFGIVVARGTKVTEDPNEIVPIAAKVAQFDLPAGLKPIFGMEQRTFGLSMVLYADRKMQQGQNATSNGGEAGEPGTVVMLMKFSGLMAGNQQQMDQQMQIQMRNQRMGINVQTTKQLTYTIRGQPVQVTEGIGTNLNTGERGRQYTALVADSNGPLMIMLLTTEPADDPAKAAEGDATKVRLSEDEVQKFFESIK
jgi:hypothetical protein